MASTFYDCLVTEKCPRRVILKTISVFSRRLKDVFLYAAASFHVANKIQVLKNVVVLLFVEDFLFTYGSVDS